MSAHGTINTRRKAFWNGFEGVNRMKVKYEIRAVNLDKLPNRTVDEYQKALNEATPVYKNSFEEVVEYLGKTPHHERAGYSTTIGNTDYLITRIQ